MRGNTPRAQADAGMGDVKRQLIYKGQWRHTQVILAPMWFPSSKTCSACGTVNANLKRLTQTNTKVKCAYLGSQWAAQDRFPSTVEEPHVAPKPICSAYKCRFHLGF